MNREQYESLKAMDLKGIAKSRGVKNATRLKKEELIELMLKLDEEEAEKAKPKQEETVHRTKKTIHQAEKPVEEKREDPVEEKHEKTAEEHHEKKIPQYDDAKPCEGFLEVLTDGYGFLRSNGFMSGDNDIYVSPSQIRRFNLKTGDIVTGSTRKNNPNDKFGALLYIDTINDMNPEVAARRPNFEDLTPIFPNERIRL